MSSEVDEETKRCEVCGEVSEDRESCHLCCTLCCSSCLGMSGLYPTCEEMMQDEVGL